MDEGNRGSLDRLRRSIQHHRNKDLRTVTDISKSVNSINLSSPLGNAERLYNLYKLRRLKVMKV